jgi:hypothetical protein
MSQPQWKFLANLGDRSPLDHGGYFIFTDETGVYEAEAELLMCPWDCGGRKYLVYRFALERCTWTNGVLSDNKYHPDQSAWFATPEPERENRPQDTTYLSRLVSYATWTMEELVAAFCSDDPKERARAYQTVGEYHGWQNLDSYPLELTIDECRERYKDIPDVIGV